MPQKLKEPHDVLGEIYFRNARLHANEHLRLVMYLIITTGIISYIDPRFWSLGVVTVVWSFSELVISYFLYRAAKKKHDEFLKEIVSAMNAEVADA